MTDFLKMSQSNVRMRQYRVCCTLNAFYTLSVQHRAVQDEIYNNDTVSEFC